MSKKGSVIQRQEAQPFKLENVGSSPARPTTNILVTKKCDRCGTPLYIHQTDDPEPIFIGCEPRVIDITLDRVPGKDEIIVTGKRSTKQIRCINCHRIHLLSSFDEVKDEVSKA